MIKHGKTEPNPRKVIEILMQIAQSDVIILKRKNNTGKFGCVYTFNNIAFDLW